MKIEVVSYNPDWPVEFEAEKSLLQNKLGPIINAIHHIGSTSIEGLAAKPIIDIILEAYSLELLDKSELIFELLGYEVMGEFGMPRRRYYRKGGNKRTHQIHAFKAGDGNVLRHLAFRDYMKAHPEVKIEYQNLKFELANTCNDIDCYCNGKDDFVKYHEAQALSWVANL